MCVAIYKPEGVVISKETLEKCYDTNKDGAGYVYFDERDGNPTLMYAKGFFSFEKFYESWSKVSAEKRALIHFRIATHGGISESNTHPFLFVGKKHTFAMIHNGVISDFSRQAKGKKSDTRLFTERVLAPLAKEDDDFILDEKFMRYLGREIPGNKVVILRDDGKMAFLNEQSGDWLDQAHLTGDGKGKAWFSNTHWRFRTVTPIYPRNTAWDRDTYDTDAGDSYAAWLERQKPVTSPRVTKEGAQPNSWANGVHEAKSGYPYSMMIGEHYTNGFIEEINRMRRYSTFQDGYNERMQAGDNAQPSSPMPVFRAGFYWAQHELFTEESPDRTVFTAEEVEALLSAEKPTPTTDETTIANEANREVLRQLGPARRMETE